MTDGFIVHQSIVSTMQRQAFLRKSFSFFFFFLRGGGDEGVKGIHLIQNNILMLFLVNMFINIKQFDILSAINNLFCKETNICDCRLNSV